MGRFEVTCLRSRRLEVVGEIENRRARGRHVSPSGAPVFFLCPLLPSACYAGYEVTDRKRDLEVELTLLTSVPRSPSVLHTGERGTPYNGLYREAPPEMGSFFSLKVKKGGSLLVYV